MKHVLKIIFVLPLSFFLFSCNGDQPPKDPVPDTVYPSPGTAPGNNTGGNSVPNGDSAAKSSKEIADSVLHADSIARHHNSIREFN